MEMRKVYHRTTIERRGNLKVPYLTLYVVYCVVIGCACSHAEVERHQSTGSSGSMEYSQDEQGIPMPNTSPLSATVATS